MKKTFEKILGHLVLAVVVWFILSFVLQSWLGLWETIGVLVVLSVMFYIIDNSDI